MFWTIYMVFSVSLFLWTTDSIRFESSIPYIGYLGGIIIVGIMVLMLMLVSKKKHQSHFWPGMTMVAILINLGMSVNYRCSDVSGSVLEIMKRTYLADLVPMMFVFVVIYLLIRYTKLYRFKGVNVAIAIGMVLAILGARLSGKMTGGSYLYFAGFMIFGLVFMGFPFVAACFLASDENRYWMGKVSNISWNLLCFLLYTFVIYGGCVLCNEFGLLLIIALTSTVLFFIRCKDWKSKVFYTVACAVGALVAGVKISHLLNRIRIWIDPVGAYYDSALGQKAESVLYLFRHFYSMGWWGNGLGNLSKRIYPTLNSDHVLILLMNDYSIFLSVMMVMIGIILVRWMFVEPRDACLYDRFLNLACALVVCFIILIDLASNLGSFITAGIGFPWVSDGGSVNIMLTTLVAIHCGLIGKKVMKDDQN